MRTLTVFIVLGLIAFMVDDLKHAPSAVSVDDIALMREENQRKFDEMIQRHREAIDRQREENRRKERQQMDAYLKAQRENDQKWIDAVRNLNYWRNRELESKSLTNP